MKRWLFILMGFIILDIILVIAFWQREFIKEIINPSPTPLDTPIPFVINPPEADEEMYGPSDRKIETLGLPDELGKDFDQTKNSASFIINSVDENTKIVNLKAVWPNKVLDLRVDSKITCEYGDIKIYENGTESQATSDELLSKMQNAKSENGIFSGICANRGCTEINKQCQLSVFQSKGN